MRGQHPDLCRTIKHRNYRRRTQIYPSQKLLDRYTKVIHAGKKAWRIFTHSFKYRPTKGWSMSRRTD